MTAIAKPDAITWYSGAAALAAAPFARSATAISGLGPGTTPTSEDQQ